jgi:hypothetical protein
MVGSCFPISDEGEGKNLDVNWEADFLVVFGGIPV